MTTSAGLGMKSDPEMVTSVPPPGEPLLGERERRSGHELEV